MISNMDGTDLVQDIITFHEHFSLHEPLDLDYDGPPRLIIEPWKLQALRHKCLLEETQEYENADTVEKKLDALVDLIYIAIGTAYLHGFAPVFYEAWRRVHSANMTKVRSSASKESSGRGCSFDIVKPAGFVPPDLRDLVRR